MSDYKESGVDRSGAANWIGGFQEQIHSRARPEILSQVGGFGAIFESPKTYKEPVWVATTDGVGTKLLLAEEAGDEAFFPVGIDAVAMCVNDLLACRAEPLIFLDYLALDRLSPSRMNPLLKGVMEGCRQAGCSLVGGETAEMPGFYPAGRLDIAGFSLGVLEKANVWKSKAKEENLKIIGFPSDGFHSNGFSLVRQVMKKESWSLDSQVEGQTLGDYLLRPTKIYVQDLLTAVRSDEVLGAAHITGGGLVENLPRIFDKDFQAKIATDRISVNPLMWSFAERAGCSREEAFSTWNMGIGFVLLCREGFAEELCKKHSNAILIGELQRATSSEAVILS